MGEASAAPLLGLTVDEVLQTTRAVRQRLDFRRPVERALIEECLRLAFQAPNGGNGQDWAWVLVDEPSRRSDLAELYRAGMGDYIKDPPEVGQQNERLSRSVSYLAEHLQEVPVLVVPTIGRRYSGSTPFEQASRWGSILPAAWSFMLALRERGLGSAWTTLHLYREREAAELLGIPYPENTQVGLFPVGYTIGTDFRPGERSLSEGRVFWNQWGAGPP